MSQSNPSDCILLWTFRAIPPLDLEYTETPKDEKQDMAREIDRQKKIEDPNYQGAFHEKKKNRDKVDKNRRLKNKSSMEKQRASGKISAYMGSGRKKKK